MTIRFLEPARDELAEAAAYYNVRKEGLGDEFVREVRTGVAKILELPLAWAVVRGDVRRYRIRRFPYGLTYASPEGDEIVVIAVAHASREPEYSVDRLGGLG